MDFSQQISLENKQILSQSQLQSLEILSMDGTELHDFLQNEYMNNPLMECTESPDSSAPQQQIYQTDNFSVYNDTYNRKISKNYKEDSDCDINNMVESFDSNYLKNYFLEQIPSDTFSKKELFLAVYLIENLDSNGFLPITSAEIASNNDYSETEIEKVLTILKSLEPCGVFSQTLSECLLKQLEAQDIHIPELSLIIRDYLSEISEGKINTVSRNTGLTTAQIRTCIAQIEKLNPRPLSGIQRENSDYIVPDIIFDYIDGSWEISINDYYCSNYHINSYYFNLMHTLKDPELAQYFKSNLERCRFILNSIEQRNKTMQQISARILSKQEKYLLGQGNLFPMTMNELAQELNISPSTVSRAIKGKYIKFPAGTILLKNLFSAAVSGNKDSLFSSTDIKKKIKEFIDTEDKRKPYSDSKLVKLLSESGIKISRRAVAKYREELWIKSSYERKTL